MANFVTLVSQLVSSDVFGTLVIDVPGGSKNGGTPVILFQEHDFNPGDNQLWELRLTGESDGSGHPFVFIINKNSGLALTVPNIPQFDVGAPVFQTTLLQSDNQKWLQFPPPNQPGLFLFSNKHSAMVLDVKGANSSNGTPIIQNNAILNSKQLFNPNQLWSLGPGG